MNGSRQSFIFLDPFFSCSCCWYPALILGGQIGYRVSQFPCICWDLIFCQSMWSVLEKVLWGAEKKVYSFVIEWNGCLPQTDTKIPLLETIHTPSIEYGEVKLVPTESHYLLPSLIQEGTLHAIRTETHHQANHNPFDLQWCPVCKIF